jgi:LPS sulfotransferase NodH
MYGRDMKDIIVIGQQRTGSNLLCYALSFFDGYRNINEFYSMDNTEFLYPLFMSEQEYTQLFDYYGTQDYRQLLKSVHQAPQESFDLVKSVLKSNVILKILDFHFDRNKTLNYVFDKDVKFIITERNNTLEQFVSLKIAEQNEVWYNENTNDFKININIREYNQFKITKQHFYSNLFKKISNKKFIIINYERDLANGITDNLLDRLEGFLKEDGITISRTEKPRNLIFKQSNIDIKHKILNYEEIKDFT